MVVAKDAEPSPVYDVVFVVEKTANLVPYFDVLMKSYILPTLEHFNNGPPDPTDYGIDYSCTLYNVVTFHAGDIAPEPAATCNTPTNSIHELITYLEELDFVGGAAQGSSHIAEGLSTALQVFDNIKSVRYKGVNTQRHCILVCNSPPYHMGAEESNHDYRGFNSEQLASMLGKRGIHLSIISPRKIAALQKMFDAASAGEGSYSGHLQKDYTTDLRHMVLLHGYQLQERSHSPTAEEDKQGDTNKVGGASGLSPAPSMGGTDGQFKVPSSIMPSQAGGMQQPGQQPNQQVGPGVMGGPGGQMGPGMHPGQHMPSHSQATGMPSQIASMLQNQSPQQGGQRMPGPMGMGEELSAQQKRAVIASMQLQDKNPVMLRGPVSQPGMMPPGNITMSSQGMMMVPPGQQMVMNPNNPMTSQAMGMQGGPPNQGMMQTNMPMSPAQMGFPPGTSQVTMGPRTTGAISQNAGFPGMMGNAGGPGGITSTAGVGPGNGDMAMDPSGGIRPNLPPGLRDRKVVWTGALEYHEKSKTPLGQVGGQQPKITWLLSCRISIASIEPDLSTVNWPEKLSLQLLPQNMLSELQALCRNSRQVAFHFSNTDQDALRNLHKLMGTGFAGCVHFPPQSASETRIILLLFSVKKRAFIGLIPNDQSAFVQGIKNVLTQHKLKTPAKGMNPGMAQAAMAAMGQMNQNLLQGQAGVGMDASTLTVGQPSMVPATTGPGGGAGPSQGMMTSQGPNAPQQQMRQQLMMQQQHGRAPGPQNQSGVMPPGSQASMQGMQMGQMTAQPGQNFPIDDFNFPDLV
ncbi:hypothetical protein BaRGS_00020879 [Batillaria attramentaria]|uniref:Mediator of RNA polymerase II transcription subunit 25 n=1 Tax=Batillaria attramentaria TaxID=370345 RepID=A0ABD0KL47_9CAEN